jgi:hypothetical protein
MVGLLVNNEFEIIGKVAIGPNLRNYPNICLEGLRKGMKTSEYPMSLPRLEFFPILLQV